MGKLAAFITGVISVLIFSCSKPSPIPGSANALPSPGDVPVSLAIDLSQQGQQIPVDFTGLSFETQALSSTSFFNNNNTALIHLVQGLGHGILRVGGASADKILWSGGKQAPADTVLGPGDVDGFFAFAGVAGWRAMFTLNLGSGTAAGAAMEAQYIYGKYGNQLACFEIGNEPDLYVPNGTRGASYTYEAFKHEYSAFYDAIHAVVPNAVFSGPSTASGTWIGAFARDEHTKINWVTGHYYKLGMPSDTVATIARLLDGNTGALNLAGVLGAAARSYQLSYRVNECNAINSTGEGIGNTLASALWGLDFMFALAEQGAAGINFHASKGVSTPIAFLDGSASAMPLYYGMLFFSRASSGRLLTVKHLTEAGLNLTAHAVRQKDGMTLVTLINKDLSKEAFVSLSTIGGERMQKATVMRLKGPSPQAHAGILLGGDSVHVDGTWAAKQTEEAAVLVNSCTVKVPACSAVLLTLR